MTSDEASAASSQDAALFLPPALRVEHRADGAIAMASAYALLPALEPIMARLDRHAHVAPMRVCIAERGPDGWHRLGYAAAAEGSAGAGAARVGAAVRGGSVGAGAFAGSGPGKGAAGAAGAAGRPSCAPRGAASVAGGTFAGAVDT